jgi:hypothetical protein
MCLQFDQISHSRVHNFLLRDGDLEKTVIEITLGKHRQTHIELDCPFSRISTVAFVGRGRIDCEGNDRRSIDFCNLNSNRPRFKFYRGRQDLVSWEESRSDREQIVTAHTGLPSAKVSYLGLSRSTICH